MTPAKGKPVNQGGEEGPPGVTLGSWIAWASKRLQQARVDCRNGMLTPRNEAEYLVCHAVGQPFEQADKRLKKEVPAESWPAARGLVERRARERTPVAYLTREAFFAGERYYVDQRVLIPRSRIENLIDDPRRLRKLLGGRSPARILDLCTGSGCLAVAMARLFPDARVDAADLSADALEVAAINRRRFKLESRLRLFQSDLYHGLPGERYDFIVTNPPYVPEAVYQALSPEYHHEPALALRGGGDGLELVEPLLRQAPDHLTPHGVLLCEVGDDVEEIMGQVWPELPVTWVWFKHFQASGVFAINRKGLERWA